MLDLKTNPSLDFPDDPLKWDGWSKYNSDNPYERLCFAPNARPNAEQIQQHCTALMQWWQKKLRLKNIEAELHRSNARRGVRAPLAAAAPAAPLPRTTGTAEQEFHRILTLSKLHLGDATPLVRQIFVTIAENLGIRLERAEQLLERYLDDEEGEAAIKKAAGKPTFVLPARPAAATPSAPPTTPMAAPRAQLPAGKIAATRSPAGFASPVGAQMVLIPGGEFIMGSDAADAGLDEQPLTPVTLTEFYMSRHPVTNAQYERFDPSHRQ
jgi:hypothetical protein